MNRRQFITAVGVAAFAGCTGSGATADAGGGFTVEKGTATPGPPYTSSVSPGAYTNTRALKFVEADSYRDDYDTLHLTGIIENVSGVVIDYAQVTGYFLDANETRVGESLDNATDLPPGQRWQYDMAYLGDADVEFWQVVADVL